MLDFSDPQRVLAARMGITIPDYSFIDGLNHLYGYVGQEPLKHTDPTGEASVVTAIVTIGGVCYSLYTLLDGAESCGDKYPNHKDILHSDHRAHLQCVSGVAGVTGRGAGMGSDPFGTASSVIGEQVACPDKNECK